MRRGAQAVPLSVRGVRWGPVGVIDAQGWHVPGALLQHLRDRGIVQVKAVFDGIASAIQRSMQPNAAVSVTGYLLAPAVSLIHNCAQFLDGEGRLRNQSPILSYPRAMRHVHL